MISEIAYADKIDTFEKRFTKIMVNGLVHFHSTWRYVVLLLILVTIFKSLAGWFGNKDHTAGDAKLALFANISLHIQLLVGLILYFTSAAVSFIPISEMKGETRYWTVEHMAMMIVAVVVITIGRTYALKAEDAHGKHKRTGIMYILGLAIIFMSIPWPWSTVDRPYLPF